MNRRLTVTKQARLKNRAVNMVKDTNDPVVLERIVAVIKLEKQRGKRR